MDFSGSDLPLQLVLEWRPLGKHVQHEATRSPRWSPDIDCRFHLCSLRAIESDWLQDIRTGGSVSISFLVFDVHCAPPWPSPSLKAHLSRVGWALDSYSADVMRHPAATQLFRTCHGLSLVLGLYLLVLGSERYR
jgi:hypothetical protein